MGKSPCGRWTLIFLKCFNAISSKHCWPEKHREIGQFTHTKTNICVAQAFSSWLMVSMRNMLVSQIYSGMVKKNGTLHSCRWFSIGNFALPQILRGSQPQEVHRQAHLAWWRQLCHCLFPHRGEGPPHDRVRRTGRRAHKTSGDGTGAESVGAWRSKN